MCVWTWRSGPTVAYNLVVIGRKFRYWMVGLLIIGICCRIFKIRSNKYAEAFQTWTNFAFSIYITFNRYIVSESCLNVDLTTC